MRWFTLATLTPVVLLALGAFLGGIWAGGALLYMTLFVYAMDRLTQGAAVHLEGDEEFPVGHGLALTLGVAHLLLTVIAVWALSGVSGLSWLERGLCFLGFGLFFGQVSNANAHELIHKSSRWPRRLGVAVYVSLLFGHHASAHPRVHHIWVASDGDPNTARLGEGFYHFWPRAWFGSFIEGFRAESAALNRAGKHWRHHPYWVYVGGALFVTALAWWMAGLAGALALIAVTTYAQMQHLVSDYIQHYGLRRAKRENGKLEPVGPQHSWNAPQFFSSALMLNVPRHSDHHMNPARPFPALQLDQSEMPVLPRSLPVMGVVAMLPPLWRKMMDRRVKALGQTG